MNRGLARVENPGYWGGSLGRRPQSDDRSAQWRPDVVLMDMFLPGISGLQLLTKLHGLLATTRIVVLTRAAGPGLSVIVIRSGASAFLTKASSGAEILHAVSEVLLGQQYVSPLARKDWGLGADESEAMLRLTARERTVIQLLARGMTNIEIGHLMAISPRGVHFHRSNIRRRLDLHTDAELLRFAVVAQMFSG